MILVKFFIFKIRIIIVNGWMFNFEFIICGEIILFLNCCIIVMIIIMYKVCIGDMNSFIIIVGVVLINGFKLGMMFVNVVIIFKMKVYGKLIIK